ncbi:MAG: SDR family NAD(P)-dependent oxidoreductase [Eubacteriales bacterium]|nr:SDR family NAD(P)-dependent oxidoreductase [Eubacteriales bacterium]
MKLRCDKILITGGSSGIGLAVAQRFAREGVQLVITGRDAEKLERARAQIASPWVHTMVWDSADVTVCRDNLRRAAGLMGGLNGLFNNAAVGYSDKEWFAEAITPEEWDRVTDVDLKGSFFMMRYAVDFMLENQTRGNILNVASNAACMDIVNPYGVSKLSILRLTRAFGKRYGHDGIIINGIAPGATFTPMIASYAHEIDQPYPRHAIERFIHTDEIAELAFYLMSDYGEIVCGHTVVADGGDNAANE